MSPFGPGSDRIVEDPATLRAPFGAPPQRRRAGSLWLSVNARNWSGLTSAPAADGVRARSFQASAACAADGTLTATAPPTDTAQP